MKIAFLLYPTTGIRVNEDTSFWIMHELARRGHVVYHFESRHLLWESGKLAAFCSRTKTDSRKGFLRSPFSRKPLSLEGFDTIFVRKEPPFDNSYLFAMQLLDLISDKVFILNSPRGIMLFNEKLSILKFPKLIPQTFVGENAGQVRSFAEKINQTVVIKPLNEKAGAGILSTSARDKNFPSIADISTHFSKTKIMAQRFVKVRNFSDKRILLLNGEVIGLFARKPSSGDFRSNLSVGGSMHRAKLSNSDKRIVKAVAPQLVENGILFAGLDVMGPYLTEINVTSPSGIPEINALYGLRIQRKVADFIESKN